MSGAIIGRYEAVREGEELPPLEREITSQQLIRFAGAADDYSPPHWDHLYMVERGFPGVIVHGWLTASVMLQAVTAWVPREVAEIETYGVRYLRPSRPGPALYGGKVVRKLMEGGKRRIELEIWAAEPDGARLAAGTVTLLMGEPASPTG